MVDIDEFLSPERIALGLAAAASAQLFQDLAEHRGAAATSLDPATILAALTSARSWAPPGSAKGSPSRMRGSRACPS